MELNINLDQNSYKVILGNNILNTLSQYCSLNRKVLIISDDGVPSFYYETILNQVKYGYKYIIKQGEKSKNIDNYCLINKYLLDNEFSRNDLIIAVGGGVVGDLSSFVASTYKRGIDFINIPTTTLSMIDSSVGGKNGINYEGIKNVLGTFYQPKLVLIDFDVLKTLDKRNINNGLVEALKAGLIKDKEIIDLFDDIDNNLQEIIIKSLKVKISIVEQDEKEKDLRKILNFGHTIGHAIELTNQSILHGEAIARGILYLLKGDLKKQIYNILNKLNIPLKYSLNKDEVIQLIKNDKKINNDYLDLIVVEEIGQAKIQKITIEEIKEILKEEE